MDFDLLGVGVGCQALWNPLHMNTGAQLHFRGRSREVQGEKGSDNKKRVANESLVVKQIATEARGT
jgi:hypothetical protein